MRAWDGSLSRNDVGHSNTRLVQVERHQYGLCRSTHCTLLVQGIGLDYPLCFWHLEHLPWNFDLYENSLLFSEVQVSENEM